MKTSNFKLRTIGIEEKDLKKLLKMFKISYEPTVCGIDVYFQNNHDRQKAKRLIKPFAYSTKDPIEVVIGRLLKMEKLTLAVAESCSGGMLGSLITTVPGSSKYFLGGVISYANQIKERTLKVRKKTLVRYGAVSLETANEMAKGVRKLFTSDIGIGITGIAGPTGGSKKKPIGLVYIGLSAKNLDYVGRFHFNGSRSKIRTKASYHALNILRNYLIGGIL